VPDALTGRERPGDSRCRRPEPGGTRPEIPQRRQRVRPGRALYKSANNTGTHIGNLWALTGGAPLATATFSNETPSGWQEVLFDIPVAVTANTNYVVSYHTNVGHYSATGAYFSTLGVDRSPLHAPTSAAVGGNGVYVYGASALPSNSFNATNYWVDVVFDSTPDTAAPIIGDVRATPVDGSTAVVTWTTNEPATSSVDYSTDATFFAAQTQTASDGTFVSAHSMRLTGLRPTTQYYFRVRSTDRAGNTRRKPSGGPTPPPAPGQTPPLPQIFMMPSPTLHDTISADFNGGTGTGTYVAETGDGELTLAPARGSEFSGSTMPAGWATRIWSDGGTARVSGGKLTVDGARVATCVDVGGVLPGAVPSVAPARRSSSSPPSPATRISTRPWPDSRVFVRTDGVVQHQLDRYEWHLPVGQLARRQDLQRHRRKRRNADDARPDC
jgi:hypothetical protein